jgi:hypothetical protein
MHLTRGLILRQFKETGKKISWLTHRWLIFARGKLPATCIPLDSLARVAEDKVCAEKNPFFASSPGLISHSLCILQLDLTQLQSGSRNIMNFTSHTRRRHREINFAGAPPPTPRDQTERERGRR